MAKSTAKIVVGTIQSRPYSEKGREEYDRIFKKGKYAEASPEGTPPEPPWPHDTYGRYGGTPRKPEGGGGGGVRGVHGVDDGGER